ncbi:MAG TPA: sterol desaturase family protein [Chitinophaga sp.]|uniref:sterol desaturase family protein n=1 Tax=Chitinophaga sp. TaxID=1869181 RepID=UPI002BD422F5|nr:sterol desaturase family protein [Chitinophaga sp.]HVI45429.1 sterol desaturase family protein [Chitinophaga sp.]
MQPILDTLLQMPAWQLWSIFLTENLLIMLGVLAWGNALQGKPGQLMFVYTQRQWGICLLTCALNTVVTYAGYWLWKQGYIIITTSLSFRIITDAVFLFLAMDLLMYIFHYIIHKTFLYRWLHQLHHEAVDPQPIDLFILHPVETLCFGALWLMLLLFFRMNIYGIMIYLAINVFFGMMGHLGMEPLPERVCQWPGFKYLGTSSFHHHHHQQEKENFGFYTSIWDRLFRTYQSR